MATGQLNADLFTTNDGLRLITQFEGAPRLKARLCEGGAWELGYGVTFDLEGNPFTAESTCTEDEAMAYFRNALQRFENAVRGLVTTELTPNQFSALVAFCYNVGEANLAKSTVLRETNARRFYDAAAAFGMWVFATKDGYKQALRGLLRRRYAEACLFLGYDWVEACEDDAIALQRQKPDVIPGADRVLYKTPFSDVLCVAQNYPLQTDQPAEPSAAVSNGSQPSPATQPATAGLPPAKTNSASAAESRPAPGSVAPQPSPSGAGASTLPKPLPAPVPPPPMPPSVQVNSQNDMGTSTKVMYRSKRFWGGVLIITGRIIIALDVTGHFAAPVRAFIGDGVLMDWMTGVIVTMIGELILDRGEKKAEGPIDTPKRVAAAGGP